MTKEGEIITALEKQGIPPIKYEAKQKEIAKNTGTNPTPLSIAWILFNEKISNCMHQSDFHGMKMTYHSMALLAKDNKLDPFPYLQQVNICQLRDYQQYDFITKVNILTSGEGNACDTCFSQHGDIYSIEDALKKQPIPHKDCTKWLCRCSYNSIVDSD